MTRKPIPTPSILDRMEFFDVREGQKVWRSQARKRYYTWDSVHGEVEVYTKRGKHLGAIDPVTGKLIKLPVRGRTIDL